ncbi:uncharacterized protein LOC124411473 [Diprion similis]|uniref:uncharacterized protein LOC124411473 n=1 Tax=Diprion similis TaxID=362088 RepID=UPI001EF77627|nr:uncharacterized protein LOC124411473 [Diprion similis]XP_046746541.1 uncharacterized protein LOC124411473 [Diprion similis]
MKFYGIVVFLAFAAFAQGVPHNGRTKRSISDNLETLVESIQALASEVNEDLGIPAFDPFTDDSVAISINQTLAKLEGELTDLNIDGLSDFSIDTLKFTLIGLKFTFAFTWPNITFSTGYSIDGTVASILPIYGDGKASGEITNLAVSGTVAISVKNSYLYLKSMSSAVSLDDLDIQLSGLLNNDDASALIAAVISDTVPQILVDFQDVISDTVNTAVTEYVDDYLGSMTLAELLALIGS